MRFQKSQSRRWFNDIIRAGTVLRLGSLFGVLLLLTPEVGFSAAGTPAAVPGGVLAAPWVSDQGDGTYRNPVLFADYSDPDVIRVGEDYYLVASSFNCVPGLPLLHSQDLVNWRLIGHALPRLVPEEVYSKVQPGNGVWAPAIRFHDGKFWIFYPDPDFGIYLITAADPGGEWSQPVLVKAGKGLIDPCPLWDDDGQVYLVHAWAKSRAGFSNVLTVVRLSPDGRRALDEGKVVVDGNKIAGYRTIEGPKFYKRGGYYYIFAPAGGVEGGWQSVFRSRSIFGPYDDRIVLRQGRTDINGPHQGAWIDTPSGQQDWFIHFQDRDAYGRVVHLQPMHWREDGWPVMGVDPNGTGTGEPVRTWRKPDVGRAGPIEVPTTSDDFETGRLGLQWQWQANPRGTWLSFSAKPDSLRLFSQVGPSATNLWLAPNLLLQKWPAPEFVVTTALSFSPGAEGETAGLVVFGFNYAWIGVRRIAQGLRLSMTSCQEANHGGIEREIAGLAIAGGRLWLRATISEGGRGRFSYSFDNQKFIPLGGEFIGSKGRWVGAKVGLFAVAAPDATGTGFADFDWFHVEPLERNPPPASP
jgi:beta-xylosidase